MAFYSDSDLPDDPPILLAGLDLTKTLLVQPPPSSDEGHQNSCRNLGQHKWVGLHSKIQSDESKWPILNHLAAICNAFKIYSCINPDCIRNFERLRSGGFVPESQWTPFRDWVLQIISCQQSVAPENRNLQSFDNLASVIQKFYWLLDRTMRDNAIPVTGTYFTTSNLDHTDTIDFFPICEIMYWAIMVQVYFGKSPDILGEGWKKGIVPCKITAEAVSNAIRKASGRICLNRLWNITLVSDRAEQDLPALMDLASSSSERYPQLWHPHHDNCTPERCDFTSLDATRVPQLHKCPVTDTKCRTTKLRFDPSLLNDSIRGGGGTVWTIQAPFQVLRDTRYIAISHVWSDGTGVGLEPAGQVNACAFEYFAEIAKSLGCQGIWWDTISIPSEPKLRSEAINEMHNNYANAQYTVLHDRYLAQFEWADDGTPCLAVILSPWFTRGWTALECIMSRKIKVIFKKPGCDTYEPLLKDLDEEILAKDPSHCSHGHWIASKIIRRLRQAAEQTDHLETTEERTAAIKNVSDLLAVLKPRSTSWIRDRMIIAGLLAGVKVTYSMDAATITKMICQRLKYINPVSLLHEKTPMAETERWSWCPRYLYDMPASPPSDFDDQYTQGIIRNGTLRIDVWYRRVTKDDFIENRIIPCSSHPSISFKIEVALEKSWFNCIILELAVGKSLLVETIENCQPIASAAINLGYLAEFDFTAVKCRYLGSVRVVDGKTVYENINLGKSAKATFILGAPEDFPELKVAKTLPPPTRKNPAQYSFQSIYNWTEQIWIGDRIEGELLIPVRKKKHYIGDRHEVAMHNVEITYDPLNGEIKADLAAVPCFTVSSNGLVTNISKAWSLETPLYSLAGMGVPWPPISIRCTERVERRSKNFRMRIVEFAKNSFILEFSRDTITYTSIRKHDIEPSNSHPYQGIWACISPAGLYGLHLFQQPGPTEIIATSLTRALGGPPAGSPVFKAEDIENQLSIYSNQEIDCEFCQKIGGKTMRLLDDPDRYERLLTYRSDGRSPVWNSRNFHFINHDAIDMIPDPELDEEEEHEQPIFWKYRRVPPAVFFPPENTRSVTPPPESRLNARYR